MKKILMTLALVLGIGVSLVAQETPTSPALPFNDTIEEISDPKQVAAALEVVALISVLTLAPSILILTTAFTRIVIVMSFLRRALSTQTLPPNQVIMGLSLFMTFVVMQGTWTASWNDGIQPYIEGEIQDKKVAYERAIKPVRAFMFAQIQENGWDDLNLFIESSQMEVKEEGLHYDDIPLSMLSSAFVLGELKRAFIMGFFLFLPFLIIDMVVSSILMSMGMMMLPPMFISLPFKILIFILADGWRLVVGNLMASFSYGVP
jgi:flagellar biosynthetic protein FliP